MAGKFDLSSYIPVQDRITQFWEKHPDGRIITEMHTYDQNMDRVIFVAYAYKDRNNELADATGWAEEIKGGYGANSTSHVENAETSAIGRALANMGFATSAADRPSREEMGKAARVSGVTLNETATADVKPAKVGVKLGGS